MNCEESKNLIAISVFGELTPSEKAQLEGHIQECSSCTNIYEKAGKLSKPFDEREDISLPDKEKSWEIISAKALKQKDHRFEPLLIKKPVFQFSFALLLLAVGFIGGFFVHSGWQRGGEIAQLRQEVLQIREMAAASLVRQESLNATLREARGSSLYLLLEDSEIRKGLIQSLSEQTSPLVEIALVLARHINRLHVY